MSSHLNRIDHGAALLHLSITGALGGLADPVPEDFKITLHAQIDVIRKTRAAALDRAAVAIQIRDTLQGAIREPSRRINNHVLCFDVFDREKLKKLTAGFESQESAVLSAMRVGASSDYQFERIALGSYGIAENGEIVHPYYLVPGTGVPYSIRPLSIDQVPEIAKYIKLIRKTQSLPRFAALHAKSLDPKADTLRAFLLAWSALELLIGNIFPTYKKRLAAELGVLGPTSELRGCLARFAEVVKNKHHLVDKFAVISMYLDHTKDSNEIEAFRRLKDTRDSLFHKGELPDNDLPTEDVQRMFEKYLKAHLQNGTEPSSGATASHPDRPPDTR